MFFKSTRVISSDQRWPDTSYVTNKKETWAGIEKFCGSYERRFYCFSFLSFPCFYWTPIYLIIYIDIYSSFCRKIFSWFLFHVLFFAPFFLSVLKFKIILLNVKNKQNVPSKFKSDYKLLNTQWRCFMLKGKGANF